MSQLSISTSLSGIASKARWLRDDAFNLSFYVRQLTARRSFETQAIANLIDARQELQHALDRVEKAIATYEALPVNDRAA